ncbi:MAG TPA: 2-C-methyl-D-erythritol 2,4-cyclodiphosphate synthase [bacterium]
MSLRVGIGTDAHRRVDGRKLILGGVEIEADFGLEAHSDGDVLCHAILDAMLGAAALGDKGTFFPPSDPQFKDIRSTELLVRASQTLQKHRCALVNVDVSVVCEEPKLLPYIPRMKQELAAALGIRESRISIKGTTTERLGFTGRNEGIAAMAVALVDCAEDET